MLAGKTRWYEGVPHERHDGGTTYWDLLFVPLRSGDEVVGVVDLSIEVTDRYLAQRELRHTERRFQSIRTEAAAELARRDAIMDAVRFAAHRFLESHTSSWRDHLDEVMARLGRAAVASRVYIFENFEGPEGQLWSRQSHEWVAEGIDSELDNPDLVAMSYHDLELDAVVAAMSAGEVVVGDVADRSPGERAVLLPQGIRAIAQVPIFVDGRWWRFVGFDECVPDRHWSGAEVDALRAAASTLSAAIHRQHAEDRLREQQELLEKRVAALSDIAAGLGVNQPLGDTLRVIAESVVAATPAVASTAYVLDPETGELRILASSQLPPGYREGVGPVLAYRPGDDHQRGVRHRQAAGDPPGGGQGAGQSRAGAAAPVPAPRRLGHCGVRPAGPDGTRGYRWPRRPPTTRGELSTPVDDCAHDDPIE